MFLALDRDFISRDERDGEAGKFVWLFEHTVELTVGQSGRLTTVKST